MGLKDFWKLGNYIKVEELRLTMCGFSRSFGIVMNVE